MCLATPMKVVEIKGKTAIVEADNHKHEVNIVLLQNNIIEVGDYVLAHGNIAINKIPEEEAKKILRIINSF